MLSKILRKKVTQEEKKGTSESICVGFSESLISSVLVLTVYRILEEFESLLFNWFLRSHSAFYPFFSLIVEITSYFWGARCHHDSIK